VTFSPVNANEPVVPPAVKLRPEILASPPYRQGKPAGADAFKLSSNENPYPPLPGVLEAVMAAGAFNRYPDASALALREELAARHSVTPDQIHVGSGSVALLSQFIAAAAGPGTTVVYPWRSFEAYPGLVTVSGATSVQVPNRADGSHDLEALASAVDDSTRVVIVCSPNNPTSTIVSAAAFDHFMAAVPSDVLVLLDEAYAEFVTDPDAVRGLDLVGRYPNLVVLRTFSKAYGLAALRVGYALGHEEVVGALRKMRLPFAVNALAQVAALASLEADDEMRARVAGVVAERERLLDALRARWLPVVPSQGNFVWLDVPDAAAELGRYSEAAGVVLRPFAGTGVRATVGTPEENDRLVAVLDRAVHDGVIGSAGRTE
jgi:histidinol-phosphate aminotransferase